MLKLALIFLFLSVFNHAQVTKKDIHATVPQLVKAAGYPIEKHYVHTSDGYVLQLFRIPDSKTQKTKTRGRKKNAVVLVHGLMGGCDNYLLMGPKKSLAYLLADAGYDVWLANLRGTFFSSHQTLTRKDPAFWDFSFEEHGKYDAPAFIDKILAVTGLSRILYVGHSMGCTTFLTMMAQKPEYNQKIIAFVALAPGGYMANIKEFANTTLIKMDLPTTLSKRKVYSLYLPPDITALFCDTYCNTRQQEADICMKIFNLVVGEDHEQYVWYEINIHARQDLAKVIIVRSQPPSVKQFYHFAKIALTDVFTSWEDGLFGAVKPYNLSNIRTPVSIWYGENDLVTEKSQILRLAAELNQTGTLHSIRPVPWHKFNHLDFIFAKDIRDLLNIPLVTHIDELFSKYFANNITKVIAENSKKGTR